MEKTRVKKATRNLENILRASCRSKSFLFSECESESRSVMSDSLRRQGLYNQWNSLDQNTGVGSCSLPQGIFPIQGLNAGLPHCRQNSLPAEPPGKPFSSYIKCK